MVIEAVEAKYNTWPQEYILILSQQDYIVLSDDWNNELAFCHLLPVGIVAVEFYIQF